MKVLPYGWDGLLLEVENPHAWFRTLVEARDRGELTCDEIVPAAATVLLRGVRQAPDLRALMPAPPPAAGSEVTVAVRWDGMDLPEVAEHWGRSPSGVLTGVVFTVAFCGFAPGFAYLTGLPDRYHLPRLPSPRTRVPAGSVAVAGPYAGIYPRKSPGGWRLLGHTDVTLFDPAEREPALLAPGMTVRFVDA